jgi:DNA-binding XRE family transcriptional regulator
MNRKAINRIKVVLVEKNLTSKWLAEQLGKNEATISRWCTNDVQPTLNTLVKVAGLLNVQITDLLNNEQKHING